MTRALLGLLLLGCSGSGDGASFSGAPPDETGGSATASDAGTGGASAGGSVASGGAVSAGGAVASTGGSEAAGGAGTGGAAVVAAGGAQASGGATGAGGKAPSAGGASSGGAGNGCEGVQVPCGTNGACVDPSTENGCGAADCKACVPASPVGYMPCCHDAASYHPSGIRGECVSFPSDKIAGYCPAL